MLLYKYVAKTRPFFSQLLVHNHPSISVSTNPRSSFGASFISPFFYSTAQVARQVEEFNGKDVVLFFKDWFQTRKSPLLSRIFEILSSQSDDDLVSRQAADLALSQLGLRLQEELVLQVFEYGKDDVLSCLKFFDWAGRQPGFNHTRATFHAIFKIICKAKLMTLMFDFLDSFMKESYARKVRFQNILVMGYSVAGRPETALQLFGKMRFGGLDLDRFTYHLLLNALVEEKRFDAVEVIAKQISIRGHEFEITHAIIIKSLCKQNRFDEAKEYLGRLVSEGRPLTGKAVCVLVDALCKSKKFELAEKLLEEVSDLGVIEIDPAYGIWLRDLVKAGKLAEALEFLKSKKSLEGYVPDLFRYNSLVFKLLRQNRLEEVLDLLVEMEENQILPDKVTMNAVLCFFCKAGMVDVALELYNSRSEFWLSPNNMAYNYLINTLCGDGSVDEAYQVLKHSIDEGYFPGKRTFSILANALCRERKLDKMKDLVILALERNFTPSDSIYDKFISALCRDRRVKDGYLVHAELDKINSVTAKSTYYNLIYGLDKSNRGDLAARLLVEMQDKGHTPSRALFRVVIHCILNMENPEQQFHQLLQMQLSRDEPSCDIYNFFIEGAGYVRRPELARQVFEMMRISGIEPNLSSNILVLLSYLKNERISDALNFFDDLRQRTKIGRKLYTLMVVNLCKANKVDIALNFWRMMRDEGVIPSIECYEILIKSLCSNQMYDLVVGIVHDLVKSGRSLTSFIGNTLLFHPSSQELYEAWIRLTDMQSEASCMSLLGQLIGAFSGRIRVSQNIEALEEMIEQCFPLDLYTYNMLLKRVSMTRMDEAYGLFNRMCGKGYFPNRWTYDTLVHGLFKHGWTAEGKRLLEEMFRLGFDQTRSSKQFI